MIIADVFRSLVYDMSAADKISFMRSKCRWWVSAIYFPLSRVRLYAFNSWRTADWMFMKLDVGDFHETFFEPFQFPLRSDRRNRRCVRKPVYILARICTVRGPTHHPARKLNLHSSLLLHIWLSCSYKFTCRLYHELFKKTHGILERGLLVKVKDFQYDWKCSRYRD
jgi:hypothetical protein